MKRTILLTILATTLTLGIQAHPGALSLDGPAIISRVEITARDTSASRILVDGSAPVYRQYGAVCAQNANFDTGIRFVYLYM